MAIGLVGLGKMGGTMRRRWLDHGIDVIGYDHDPQLGDVASLSDLVAALPAPRLVWVMVPAGAPTTATITELAQLLAAGDLVIDGGNTRFSDDAVHAQMLADRGIDFLDCGVSGGIWGQEHGFGLMVGGKAEVLERAGEVFAALLPRECADSQKAEDPARQGSVSHGSVSEDLVSERAVSQQPAMPGPVRAGFVHAGGIGAGHYAKMVHNAIEYGLMQAYAEGYELLRARSDLIADVPGCFQAWTKGTVVRSWLLDLLTDALHQDPQLQQLQGYVADSGEGRWCLHESVENAVPMPVLAAALFARFTSRQSDSPAMKAVAALRHQFGGHAVAPPDAPRPDPGTQQRTPAPFNPTS